MSRLIRAFGQAALVIGGFLVIFFGVSKMSNRAGQGSLPLGDSGIGVAHADAPSCGDSGGDSGGGGDSASCGCDCGDSGGCGK